MRTLRSKMYTIKEYSRQYDNCLFQFLKKCLPQSGRSLELDGRHKMYCNIDEFFEFFWCLFDKNDMIGTVALKRLNDEYCELKSLYLLEQYHKKGLGHQLLKTAILKAQQGGYKKIYLDTLSSSTKAISLYEKMGFVRIGRYNTNYMADVFMVLKLDH